MTGRLAVLRLQLARLRRARAALRAASAWSALASGVLLALVAVFGLDLLFGLAVPQRVVVLLFAAAAVAWTWWRFTRPLLGRRESEIEAALIVERQQQIDSDLVAALQFERPEAGSWGSPQLTTAVVDYVAAAGAAIDVFQGLPRDEMRRRVVVLVASLAIVAIVAIGWPGHIAAFANRLCLGAMHYPTRTRIEQIVVNQAAVLPPDARGVSPIDSKAAQGRPLTFLVQCGGQLPAGGTIHLTAASGAHSHARLTLKPLSLDERVGRLREAIGKLNGAMQDTGTLSPPRRDEIATLIRFDAPEAVELLLAAEKRADLPPVIAVIDKAVADWPTSRARSMVLSGELGRLNDDVTYKVSAGDAWSDPATVRMIPLPIVELAMNATPPKYAVASAPKIDPTGRQLAVLEGSSIELAVKCANHKPLAAAWLSLQTSAGSERIELVPQDTDRFVWSPKAGHSPLRQIREELRYEVQVLDQDGLSLQTPIRGTIRIRPDQPPTGLAEVVHKVVLPTAAPLVSYRASDDFGIAKLAVIVDVERGAAKPKSDEAPDETPNSSGNEIAPAAAAPRESHRYEVLTAARPILAPSLPLSGGYSLPLSALQLAKGDRIMLVLEVTDYRGENDEGQAIGVVQRSDGLVLDISDEAGVLAAISQSDQRSADQLSEIIKRQLGIGDEP